MDIYNKLINTPQAETSGSNSASRFSYQKTWALTHLIKLHKDNQDYIFAFEFHDDVLVINPNHKSTKLSFFQVKTKKAKNWTDTQLLKTSINKKTNEKTLSILGKLYHHKTNFTTENIELSFVTNSYFTFNLNKDVIKEKDIPEKEKKTILEAINNEHQNLGLKELDELVFIHSDLNLDDHETHAKGKIQLFFKELFGENHGINTEAWYRTIVSEINQKNNYNQINITNQKDFLNNKCITRSFIENILSKLKNDVRIKPKWEDIKQLIKDDIKKPYELILFEKMWNQFSSDKLDSSSFKLHGLYKRISEEIDILFNSITNLYNTSNEVLNVIKKTNVYDKELFSDEYIKTIVFWSYYEYVQRKF